MLFAYALIAWSGRKRLIWALWLLPVLLLASFTALICVSRLIFPVGIERVQSVRLGLTTLNAYQTNGGATTSYGMIVRQELQILPGILIVRQLADEYPPQPSSSSGHPRDQFG